MKLFSIFDEDVQATTRTGMMHLQKMSDVEFIQFVQNVAQTMQGQLKNLKVSLKVDGAGARFGLDSNRRPFLKAVVLVLYLSQVHSAHMLEARVPQKKLC